MSVFPVEKHFDSYCVKYVNRWTNPVLLRMNNLILQGMAGF